MAIAGDSTDAFLLAAAFMGVSAVFVLSLLERIILVLPSFGLFAAIGIAAGEGLWGLPAAIFTSIVGSSTGALAAYALGMAIAARGTSRLRHLLRRRDRWGRHLRQLRRHGPDTPFMAQLLPGARIVAPLVIGAVPHERWRFAMATIAGISVWNASFISLGYAIGRIGSVTNGAFASAALVGALTCIAVSVSVFRAQLAKEPRQAGSGRRSAVLHSRASQWKPAAIASR